MKRISLLAILTALSLSSCAVLQRSSGSGYSDYDTWSSRRQVTGDEASNRSVSLSGDQRESMEARSELKSLEARIVSDDDRRQYFRIKPFLNSDQERIEFLRLPDRRARERWVRALGVSENKNALERHIATAVDEGDLVLGMPKGAVLESWGDPIEREVAGNPDNENERWIYYNYVNSPDGYQREARIIYFENGQVIGWETR